MTKKFVITAMHKLCAWLIVSMACLSVTAQSISPEQLEQLRRLTPAQKQQLLEALGGGSSSVTTQQPEDVGPLVVPALPEGNDEEIDEDRFVGNDSLVLSMSLPEESLLTDKDYTVPLTPTVYELDGRGYLLLPGVTPIILSGLTPEQAMLRLKAEPSLYGLNIEITRLPVDVVGSDALQPFGYDLFEGVPTTFAPATDIPVPVNYVIGPGDVITLLLFGKENAEYRLAVERNGQINIPEIGPVVVAGMRFEQMREELNSRVSERYIGVTVAVSLGELRSIRVFVLGDVNSPGSYTVSSLSTITNALFLSGGVAPTGSLRAIEHKRSNRRVGTLDLYDLLLRGNTKADRRLQPGDVIYVPPVLDQVSIYGEVNRPAIYEIKQTTSLGQIVTMAGGVNASAFDEEIVIERFESDGSKSVTVADLDSQSSMIIRPGDTIYVPSALDNVEDGVYVKGYVARDTVTSWRPGLRLTDVLNSVERFRLQADREYLLIRRYSRETGRISLVSANWQEAFNNPLSDANLELKAGDIVNVFPLSDDRALRIAPLMAEVEQQSSSRFPTESVSIQGWVMSPGEYPYEKGMFVSDLIRAAGSTRKDAYLEEAELTRIVGRSKDLRTIHVSVPLDDILNNRVEDLPLVGNDVLTVKAVPLNRTKLRIDIEGEVQFPGSYSITRGERLSSVVERAGGLTDLAFIRGGLFLREDLKERETEQLENLEKRLRSEIAALSSDLQGEARQRAEALLAELETTEALGRLVIDLELSLLGDQEHDVVLKDGDRLIIPAQSQEVTVIGEVQYPTSHIFEGNQDQFSYIYKSGGLTTNADSKRIYLIRADGSVVAQSDNRWFGGSGRAIAVLPGDTIVVPFDSDRISKLTLWSTVSGILYNIGVAAAAVSSF